MSGRVSHSWVYSAEMQLRRRVYELDNSLPWRTTAPLRAIRRALTGGRDRPYG